MSDLKSELGEELEMSSKVDDVDETAQEVIDEQAVEIEESAEADTSEQSGEPRKVIVKRGGFFPTVIGGVLCAGLGYGAAQYVKPEGWPFPAAGREEAQSLVADAEFRLEEKIEKLITQNDALTAQVAELKSEVETAQSQAANAEQFAPLQSDLAALAERVVTLEEKPAIDGFSSPEARAAFDEQLAKMQGLIDAEVTRLSEQQDQILADEKAAKLATAAIVKALDAGEPFGSYLGTLENVPEALAANSDGSVATLSELKLSFPDAARQALVAVSEDAYEAGEQSFVSNFLFTQLGYRSTEPSEGSDPDAVLSRAEYALENNDLAKALGLVAELPDVGKDYFTDWAAQAQTRLDVTSALQQLTAQ